MAVGIPRACVIDWRQRANDETCMAIITFGCFDFAIKKAQEIAFVTPIGLGFPLSFALQEAHASILGTCVGFAGSIGIGQIGCAKAALVRFCQRCASQLLGQPSCNANPFGQSPFGDGLGSFEDWRP